jgi:hypothetical protein
MEKRFRIGDLVKIKDTGYFGLEQGRLAGKTGVVIKIYDGWGIYVSEVVQVCLEDKTIRGFYTYELTLLVRDE